MLAEAVVADEFVAGAVGCRLVGGGQDVPGWPGREKQTWARPTLARAA